MLFRSIKAMQDVGVILTCVSKNNEADALEVLQQHPHMILRDTCFSLLKINWEDKYKNIRMIAVQLNIGLDAMVFVDDNQTERESVKHMLPEVTVPDFPRQIELLPHFAETLYKMYFKQLRITSEDKEKTAQYHIKIKSDQLQQESKDFNQFLQQLAIWVKPYRNCHNHLERIQQLFIKTNQFNLTTIRYTVQQVVDFINAKEWDVWSFEVGDKFGDSGIVGVILVDKRQEVPVIESFVLSCRVMGKRIEYALIDFIEKQLETEGYSQLEGKYHKTAKNVPVQALYPSLGYKIIESGHYGISLTNRPTRDYFVHFKEG